MPRYVTGLALLVGLFALVVLADGIFTTGSDQLIAPPPEPPRPSVLPTSPTDRFQQAALGELLDLLEAPRTEPEPLAWDVTDREGARRAVLVRDGAVVVGEVLAGPVVEVTDEAISSRPVTAADTSESVVDGAWSLQLGAPGIDGWVVQLDDDVWELTVFEVTGGLFAVAHRVPATADDFEEGRVRALAAAWEAGAEVAEVTRLG